MASPLQNWYAITILILTKRVSRHGHLSIQPIVLAVHPLLTFVLKQRWYKQGFYIRMNTQALYWNCCGIWLLNFSILSKVNVHQHGVLVTQGTPKRGIKDTIPTSRVNPIFQIIIALTVHSLYSTLGFAHTKTLIF